MEFNPHNATEAWVFDSTRTLTTLNLETGERTKLKSVHQPYCLLEYFDDTRDLTIVTEDGHWEMFRPFIGDTVHETEIARPNSRIAAVSRCGTDLIVAYTSPDPPSGTFMKYNPHYFRPTRFECPLQIGYFWRIPLFPGPDRTFFTIYGEEGKTLVRINV